jgi:hypothetical protein
MMIRGHPKRDPSYRRRSLRHEKRDASFSPVTFFVSCATPNVAWVTKIVASSMLCATLNQGLKLAEVVSVPVHGTQIDEQIGQCVDVRDSVPVT